MWTFHPASDGLTTSRNTTGIQSTDCLYKNILFTGLTNRVILPIVPLVKLTTVANQPTFPVVGPRTWNNLPDHVDFSRIVIHLPSAT